MFDPYRPTGARFGILVHALLAHVPLDATTEQVTHLAAVQARLLRASDDERAAAAAMVDRALRHALLDRARAATAAGRSCRREVSLGVVVDGVVVDGQADLLFDDGDRWLVVDFKTDVEITGSEAVYQRQVALYMDAAQRATGATVEGALLQGVSRRAGSGRAGAHDRRRVKTMLESATERHPSCLTAARPDARVHRRGRRSRSRSASVPPPRCSAS